MAGFGLKVRKGWAALFLLICLIHPTIAQTEYAATLLITHDGVEVQRVNTTAWITLRAGAVMPIGTGDQVRTTADGRALLTIKGAEILLLPLSQLTLIRLDETTAGVDFEAFLTGKLAQRTPDQNPFSSYQLSTDLLAVTQPAAHFGVESITHSYVVAAQGETEIQAAEETLTLPEGSGLRVTADGADDPLDLTFPASFAQVEGLLEGCPGVIQNLDGLDFRVRSGPSTDYYGMGSITDGTPIQVMGSAGDGGFRWYKIQFQSDFGWVIGRVVQTTCDNLPNYPFGFNQEDRYSVRDIQAFEIDLLQPFFGTPAEDTWFYNPG